MSLARTLSILKKEFALGPRSPFFYYTLLLPVALTLLFQFAFGSLFAAQPRLAIIDEGSSEITSAVAAMRGIELTILSDEDELLRRVAANDFDAGLILPVGFDAAVRDGSRPILRFHIGGESHASNRIILAVTAADLVRDIEGISAPVQVEVVGFGDEGVPLALRLVPIIVFYALAMAGIFVPGASLVEEKEQGTLMGMLVTPAKASEVLVAKWSLGFLLASVMSLITLILNGAMGSRPFDVVVVVMVAAGLTSMLGLLVGVVAKDSTMLFGLIKGSGIVLFAPVLFYLFPSWPQWIAKLFPLYWIIEPVWQVSIMGERLSAVWLELGVALLIAAALLPIIIALSRKMLAQMAAR